MKKVAIVIEKWKLEIFKRQLEEAGYAFEQGPGLTADTLLLRVNTSCPAALGKVVRAAINEAEAAGPKDESKKPAAPLCRMVPVESSNVEAVGHTGVDMIVRYQGGRLYTFANVKPAKFIEILNAPSTGKAINALGVTGKRWEE